MSIFADYPITGTASFFPMEGAVYKATSIVDPKGAYDHMQPTFDSPDPAVHWSSPDFT